jgi:hypothetical protein
MLDGRRPVGVSSELARKEGCEMAWLLLLIGSIACAADQDGVRGAKQMRGWVTAHLLWEGMPNGLYELLTAGMNPMRFGFSSREDVYLGYGLRVTVNYKREVTGAWFVPQR